MPKSIANQQWMKNKSLYVPKINIINNSCDSIPPANPSKEKVSIQ